MARNALIRAQNLAPASVAASDAAFADTLLEFQSPSAAVLATRPIGAARGVIWVVSFTVISFFLASGLIKIDKVVTAQGKVASEARTLVMQPLDTAIVRAISVHEGQFVHQGDMLAELDPTFAAADLGALREQVRSYQAEVDRLAAEANDKPYAPPLGSDATRLQAAVFAQRAAEKTFKLENYQQKIDGLETTIARSLAEANYYRQRLAVAADVEGMRRELQDLKVGSRLNSLAAADNRIEMTRYLTLSQNNAEAATRDLRAMIAERDAYLQNWRAEVLQNLTDQGRKLSDAEEQLKKAALRRQLVELRAPEDAIVLTVAKVSVGSVLQTGSQFITLVPASAPLLVEANAAGSDAGFLRVGDPVAVKFDTFPFTQYGDAEGVVKVISPDSFTQSDPANPLSDQPHDPVPGGRVFYRVRISLDQIKLHGVPEGFKLAPGMPVTADIKVGRRTILNYLLGRVLPVASEGMREP